MALWDYHVSRGGSFVGLDDAELAQIRRIHPVGVRARFDSER